MDTERRIAILAEGSLDFHHGKTATSILRYRPRNVVAVIDSEHAGRTTDSVLGIGGDTPVVRDIEEALPFQPTELLIGIAPRGGGLPDPWRRQIIIALSQGIELVNGLHVMMGEDEEFVRAAASGGATISDVRRPPEGLRTADFAPHREGSHVITFVGSDCAVGKMTAALEMRSAADRMGLSTAFVATGQTGIMLEGSGIAIDRVIGDFMAGAAEKLVLEASERADWVFVEGQGSLLHPAYSGVTLALLHGSAPDAMVLVYPPMNEYIDEYPIRIPPLPQIVQLYEAAAGWTKPAKVVAIALNTRGMTDEEADDAARAASASTGLPAADPVRGGAETLVHAVTEALVSTTSSPQLAPTE
jgi:uncharacterized NAD-dependent epimerase/dehydratase family protein